MQHLLFFSYISLLSSGFAGITFTVILVKRFKEPVLIRMLAVISLFTVWLAVAVVEYYLSLLNLPPVIPGVYLGGLNTVLGLLIYGGFFTVMLSIYPAMSRVWIAAAAAPLILFYLFVAAVLLLAPSIPALQQLTRADILPYSVAATGIFLTFIGYIFVKGAQGAAQDTIRFLLRWQGRLLLIFVPLSILLTAAGLGLEISDSPTMLLNYLLFFSWNILSIAAFIRYHLKPAALIDDNRVSEGFIKSFSISPREVEVIDLISHGLSNKEIASSLNVSFTTARTHVYNIFRKTGAASRVELLRIVSGYRE